MAGTERRAYEEFRREIKHDTEVEKDKKIVRTNI